MLKCQFLHKEEYILLHLTSKFNKKFNKNEQVLIYYSLINLGLIWFQPLIWAFYLNFTTLLL